MTYILVFWTIVGGAGTSTSTWYERDWRPIGEFKSAAACQHASVALGIGNRSRCIPTDTLKESKK